MKKIFLVAVFVFVCGVMLVADPTIASAQGNEVSNVVRRYEQMILSTMQNDTTMANVSRAKQHALENYDALKRLGIRVDLGDLGNIAQMMADNVDPTAPSIYSYSPDTPIVIETRDDVRLIVETSASFFGTDTWFSFFCPRILDAI